MKLFKEHFKNAKVKATILNKIESLKKDYYVNMVKKLQAGEAVNVNLEIKEGINGYIKSIAYDKNKNIEITMTLDVDTARKIINFHIDESIKKDTSILEVGIDDEYGSSEIYSNRYDIKDENNKMDSLQILHG